MITQVTSSNIASKLLQLVAEKPDEMALWTLDEGVLSFGEFSKLVRCAQEKFVAGGVVHGDTILVLVPPSRALFAALVAAMGLGATVLFVEPWMDLKQLSKVISLTKPKLFFASSLGRIWGLRSKTVRDIPSFVMSSEITLGNSSELPTFCEREASERAIVTFSSGTSGIPKGIVRTNGYLKELVRILDEQLHMSQFAGPDLVIFVNFVLLNLSMGRGSLLISRDWSQKELEAVALLPREQQPDTVVTNPAFLERLLLWGRNLPFKKIEVGGALIDCALIDRAAQCWSKAELLNIYGSSEAEPIAWVSARQAVEKSRAAGYVQALCLGPNIPDVHIDAAPEGLWVSGPNVCPAYLLAESDNRKHKRIDSDGRLWHFVGDRIEVDGQGDLWFKGRGFQSLDEFELEQKIYAKTLNTSAMLVRETDGSLTLFGEGLKALTVELRAAFPTIARIVERKIVRDSRHRSRINRSATLVPEWQRHKLAMMLSVFSVLLIFLLAITLWSYLEVPS